MWNHSSGFSFFLYGLTGVSSSNCIPLRLFSRLTSTLSNELYTVTVILLLDSQVLPFLPQLNPSLHFISIKTSPHYLFKFHYHSALSTSQGYSIYFKHASLKVIPSGNRALIASTFTYAHFFSHKATNMFRGCISLEGSTFESKSIMSSLHSYSYLST